MKSLSLERHAALFGMSCGINYNLECPRRHYLEGVTACSAPLCDDHGHNEKTGKALSSSCFRHCGLQNVKQQWRHRPFLSRANRQTCSVCPYDENTHHTPYPQKLQLIKYLCGKSALPARRGDAHKIKPHNKRGEQPVRSAEHMLVRTAKIVVSLFSSIVHPRRLEAQKT